MPSFLRGRNLHIKDTTLYGLGICLAALVAIIAVWPPRDAFSHNDIPAAIVSGTSLPAMLNSPDTRCGDSPCTDYEFDGVIGDLEAQWAITPEWIRSACVANTTFPSMEHCILHQTESWLAQNENREAPWLDPANVGPIVKRAGK